MLDIFNKLKPFFEDVYRELSVREYGRMTNVSPPTASTILTELHKEDLLTMRKQGVYLFFKANRDNPLFRDLASAFWRYYLKQIFEPIHEKFLFKKIMLFGSIAKLENTQESDIDLFIDSESKEVNLSEIEKKLKRKIQLHFRSSLKNKHLKSNIEKGVDII